MFAPVSCIADVSLPGHVCASGSTTIVLLSTLSTQIEGEETTYKEHLSIIRECAVADLRTQHQRKLHNDVGE